MCQPCDTVPPRDRWDWLQSPLFSCISPVFPVSSFFIVHAAPGYEGESNRSQTVGNAQHGNGAEGRPLFLSLFFFMWHSGMNQTVSCDGWSWKLSARELSRQSRFITDSIQERLMPGLHWRIALWCSHRAGDWGSTTAVQWWRDSSLENYMERREIENTKPPFNQSCLLENPNEHQMGGST